MARPSSGQRVTSNMGRRYTVSEKDLPVSCPLPWTARWNSHPRVYLPLEPGIEATCPYCGAVFSLAPSDSGDQG